MVSHTFSELVTPVPAAVIDMAGLHFVSLTGEDALSQPFEYTVRAISSDPDITAKTLLGEVVTVIISANPLEQEIGVRFYSGIVDRFRFMGPDSPDRYLYELTLRPRLWLLSKSTDNRIFQEKSVEDIVSEVLDQHGVNVRWQHQASLPTRDYCVQYGETDLAFVQRLLQHEGLFYHFEFDDGDHTMVISDVVADLKPALGNETIRFREHDSGSQDGTGGITAFARVDSIVTGRHSLTDYDFEKPSADLAAQMDDGRDHSEADKERYSYPGKYIEYGRGETLAELRLQENQAMGYEINAISTLPAPHSGHLFTLDEHPRASENIEYLIVRVRTKIWDGSYSTRFGGGIGARSDEIGVEADWQLVPADVPWRLPDPAPRPIMKGPQTAVVVGPGGEEIYTDKYSRVKVQFHWDRLGGKDENSSCWVRVSSAWAGSGWGFIQIPRIGQEVIVDFLEGDPDQPIITGRVYNAEQMPPYALPANATQSGWKSNSSKGGGGWNELRFEDLKGSEQVYFQAEKDHVELVKNDETRTIGHDWVEDVGNDATQTIGNDRTETVHNDKKVEVIGHRTVNIRKTDTETVDQDRSLTVHGNETIEVDGDSDEKIWKSHSQYVLINQSVTVGGWRMDKVGGYESRGVAGYQDTKVGGYRAVSVAGYQKHTVLQNDGWKVGKDQSIEIGKNQEMKIGEDQSFWVGGDGTYMVTKKAFHSAEDDATFRSNKNLLLEAGGDQLTLKCGKAEIVMKKDGTISIEGKDINTDASGKINSKASGDIILKGSNVKMN
ncbi:type VI secretion system Vgr family protein [Jannaschia seohaensis]|uniref:Type VI secretion system secreted protein VgrG n=1 Tax=Jannaschia seohaensis TaxID=475081 RepID=A0A2Y9B1H5_9RHOB|nr:type VI secretion system tip protein VgrG [Jannaschia seohaensis]PWJ16550.1 type VI secretion system secreted protein VgrG [Jannaschia seohaensis]SSA48787.1 type VI secretion system secreted protein VgrG [Jannaschia seohaensis]